MSLTKSPSCWPSVSSSVKWDKQEHLPRHTVIRINPVKTCKALEQRLAQDKCSINISVLIRQTPLNYSSVMVDN